MRFQYVFLLTAYYSCGFPSQSLSKVLSKLESCKISYLIADRKDNYEIDTHENFKNLNNYEKYYKKAKEEIGLKIRIEKIRKYLLKTMDKEKIVEIEKIIDKK